MSDTKTISQLNGINIELRAIRLAIEAYVQSQGIVIEKPPKRPPEVTKTTEQWQREAEGN